VPQSGGAPCDNSNDSHKKSIKAPHSRVDAFLRGFENNPRRKANGEQLSTQENETLLDVTERLMARSSYEEKSKIKTLLQAPMKPHQFQNLRAPILDPLFLFYQNQALHHLWPTIAQLKVSLSTLHLRLWSIRVIMMGFSTTMLRKAAANRSLTPSPM